MTTLPQFLRRLPYVFYALAALFFVWNLGNQWFTLTTMGQYADPSLEGVMAFQKSVALYGSLLEAAYILANGAMLHILIAIFDKLKGSGE